MTNKVAFVKWSALLLGIQLLLLLLMAGASDGKRTFDRCSLAKAMDKLDVPRNQLARWVCIAEHGSHYRTYVIGPPNDDGSTDHGIFQINDRIWCQPSNGQFSYNGCNVNCDALRTDHIDIAMRCAQLIQQDKGWGAWSVFKPKCSGQLPSIKDCFGGKSNHLVGASMHGKF
ncbi:GH21144 [Drosophila grimshawi]|uniref:lysozyme n=2 Tax=Drosophila grimshawi TaxID=7222 RepID=B4J6D4_DROGR|nr:GH21144 [Drosophila grimshawi]